jgi:hypothetical protein
MSLLVKYRLPAWYSATRYFASGVLGSINRPVWLEEGHEAWDPDVLW